MKTILGMAVVAMSAVAAYNHKARTDPEGAATTVRNVRQATSVVLAVGEAIWSILDALLLLFRRSAPQSPQQSAPLRFGTRPASDETGT